MAFVQTNRRCVSTLIAAAVAMMSLSGCATVAGGGSDQRVHIDSEPKGAQVRVDGQVRGVTPIDVELSRRQEHQVQLELEGRPPYVTTLKPGCNPWVFGNVLVGGLIGLAVDASTGAVSTLYPQEVKADFGPPQTPNTSQPPNRTVGNGTTPNGIQPAVYRYPSGPQPIP
jgi:PEGA domain